MAPRNRRAELADAWAALREGFAGASEGWRTIAMDEAPLTRLLAGIHFPGGEEAILVGFRTPAPDGSRDLPKGRGFLVGEVTALPGGYARWFALTRAPSASKDLFATMADDVLGLMADANSLTEPRLVRLFLGRIQAWQNFMSRDGAERLGPERELGLVGELAVYDALLTAGVSPSLVNQAWRGPMGGLHDFVFDDGAIEAKTTLSAAGFPARIGSLEQLDSASADPLFIAAVRACLQATGLSLPQWIAKIQDRLAIDSAAGASFERLIHLTGFSLDHAAAYHRQFSILSIKLFPIDDSVPRLQRTLVPPIVRSATYELDLDLITTAPISISDALDQFGFSRP